MSCVWHYELEAWLKVKVKGQISVRTTLLHCRASVSQRVSRCGLERALVPQAAAQTTPPAEIISTKPSAPSSSSWACRSSAAEAQSTLCVQKPRVNHAVDQAEPVTHQKQRKGRGKCVFNGLASNLIQTEWQLLSELTQNNRDSSAETNRSLCFFKF